MPSKTKPKPAKSKTVKTTKPQSQQKPTPKAHAEPQLVLVPSWPKPIVFAQGYDATDSQGYNTHQEKLIERLTQFIDKECVSSDGAIHPDTLWRFAEAALDSLASPQWVARSFDPILDRIQREIATLSTVANFFTVCPTPMDQLEDATQLFSFLAQFDGPPKHFGLSKGGDSPQVKARVRHWLAGVAHLASIHAEFYSTIQSASKHSLKPQPRPEPQPAKLRQAERKIAKSTPVNKGGRPKKIRIDKLVTEHGIISDMVGTSEGIVVTFSDGELLDIKGRQLVALVEQNPLDNWMAWADVSKAIGFFEMANKRANEIRGISKKKTARGPASAPGPSQASAQDAREPVSPKLPFAEENEQTDPHEMAVAG